MNEHVMVDLETLGSGPRALILSIGAVRFCMTTLQLTNDELYLTVDGKSCQQFGLEIDYDTVCWWQQQSLGARMVFEASPKKSLPEALSMFNLFVRAIPDTIIWGNGATFDNMILRNAFLATGLTYPASYRNDLCYRTMRRMFPIGKILEGTAHNALDDARSQAKTLLEIMRILRK